MKQSRYAEKLSDVEYGATRKCVPLSDVVLSVRTLVSPAWPDTTGWALPDGGPHWRYQPFICRHSVRILS